MAEQVLEQFPEGFWAVENNGIINVTFEASKWEPVYIDGKFIGYRRK